MGRIAEQPDITVRALAVMGRQRDLGLAAQRLPYVATAASAKTLPVNY